MPLDYVDINPGTVAQVHRSLQGKLVAVDHGPNDMAVRLRELDESLRLTYHPHDAIWVVWQEIHLPDGRVKESLVTSCQEDECDGRLLARVREVVQPGYDIGAAIEASEREHEKQREAERQEVFGEASARLSFALSRDLGRHETMNTAKSRAFIPRAFKPR